MFQNVPVYVTMLTVKLGNPGNRQTYGENKTVIVRNVTTVETKLSTKFSLPARLSQKGKTDQS